MEVDCGIVEGARKNLGFQGLIHSEKIPEILVKGHHYGV
jgi:hypothetical protein